MKKNNHVSTRILAITLCTAPVLLGRFALLVLTQAKPAASQNHPQ
ncbi:MAG: hypothetical protein WAT53_06915 [Nitrosomonas sp.]